MDTYWNLIRDSYSGYWDYLMGLVITPAWNNYLYYLTGLSLLIWVLELLFPWRREQAAFRKDFWLDFLYMYINFFLFSLLGFHAVSQVVSTGFTAMTTALGLEWIGVLSVKAWPVWAQFALMFVLADFFQWNIHRLLHRVPFLWKFHQVHHSVKEMGFAAHLRYHWMETVVYKSLQFIPLGLLGFSVSDFFLLHAFTIAIGHLNHANLNLGWGPLKYLLNSPKMHIWHHAKDLQGRPYGYNFGITLSVWDWVFGTAHIPYDGRDIELGFEGEAALPADLLGQELYPLTARGKGAADAS